MAKKRGGAKARNKPNAANENKPVPAEDTKHSSKEGIKRGYEEESNQGSTEGIKRVPAEDSKQGSTEGIKRVPAEDSKQGSTEGIKRGPAEDSKQGNAGYIQQGSKKGTKHESKKYIKQVPAKGKLKPGKGIRREPAEESKQGSAGADNRDSSDENDDDSEKESRSGFLKKIEQFCEKALEVFVDAIIVEILIFLEKRYKTFQKCIQNLNFITFFLFKSVMQCYLAVHFTHVLVYLLDLTGMHFEFPLKDANHFITNFRDYLAWDFKLFILLVTILSFINDLINTGHHGKNHVDGIWILLLAEVEMFLLEPQSEHFFNYLVVALVGITVARLLFEVCYSDYEDLDSSLEFLPLLVFTQLVIFILCAFLIFLYEASMFLEEYMPDISSADVIF